MKTLQKNVYYCDFCKKKGMGKAAMASHEKRCTANPNRHCGMCDYQAPYTEEDKTEHLAVGKDYSVQDYFDKLSLWHGGCPACVLSIFRQYGMAYLKEWNDKNAARTADYEDVYYPYADKVKEYWEERDRDEAYY